MLSEEEFKRLSNADKAEYLRLLKGIRGKEDLLYLAKEVLGYREVEEGVHRGMERLFSSKSKRKLGLWPRGSFKTSVLTIAGTINLMIRNPDIRILLDSEVLGNSEKCLNAIKGHMRSERFVKVYRDLISGKHRETSREFTLRTREAGGLKEPTIYAAGVGTVNVGPHYDWIIVDDPHSEKNVSSKEQIDKVIAHYRLLLSLLDPGGTLAIWGTRWHFYDLYSYILEEEAEGKDSPWEVKIEKAIRDDGSLFFPNRLSREFLDEQRKSQGAYLFSVFYFNNPVPKETQVFRPPFKKWDKKGEKLPLDDKEKELPLNIYILVDNAFSTKDSADYKGIVADGVDTNGNIYVLEAERRKFGEYDLFKRILQIGDKYGWEKVLKVGVETINYEEFEKNFQEWMGKHNKFFILERLVPDSRQSKNDRIEKALQARYSNGAVYHRKGMVDLEDELIRFPNGSHDDILDAHAYIVQMMTIPGKPENETQDEEFFVQSGFFGNSGY